MVFKKATYRVLIGKRELLEVPKKKSNQWVVYQDNKPTYFVDFYDLEKESNAIMNSLVLCAKKSIQEVLKRINKKNNINLSVHKAPSFKIIIKAELIELDLPPLPEKWLSYSL